VPEPLETPISDGMLTTSGTPDTTGISGDVNNRDAKTDGDTINRRDINQTSANNIRGPETLETPTANGTSTAVWTVATAGTLATADTSIAVRTLAAAETPETAETLTTADPNQRQQQK
jgi:hypothetical protein